MGDIIVAVIIIAIISAIIIYLYKLRKKGIKCVGCPYAKECSGKCTDESVSSIQISSNIYDEIKME